MGLPCFFFPKCWAKKRTWSAASSWSTCSPAPWFSPANRKPIAAAGATSARRTGAVSTRARPLSPRCKGFAAAATPGFRCPTRSSTRRSSTFINARRRTAACNTTSTAAVLVPPFPLPPSPVCTTPATTTANTFPACWTTARRISRISPTPASGIGTTHTTTIPRSCIARAARLGTTIATASTPAWSAKPAPTGRGTRATSAPFSRPPSI